jgi:hypothetical protein
MFPDLGHSLAVSTGSHNRVAGGQRGPREITHPCRGSAPVINQTFLLITSHLSQLSMFPM